MVTKLKNPLYDLAVFKALVVDGRWNIWNPRAEKWKDELKWTDPMMEFFLNSIQGVQQQTKRDFSKVVPDCTVTLLPGVDVVDVDLYAVWWDESLHCRCRPGTQGAREFSVKIAIVPDVDGGLSGVVSFHPSGSIS